MARRKWTYDTIQQVLDGEQPFIQVGYDKKTIKRKEGEEWTDSKGKSWKMENGAISSVNKQMDSIRELVKQKCSVCGQRMDFTTDKLDHKVFGKTGKCFDCLQLEEISLRVDAPKWAAYQEKKILSNKLGALREFKEKVLEAIDFLKNDDGKMGEVLATGEIVTFTGKSNPQWLVDAEKDLIKVNDELKKMEEIYSKLEEILK
jgi:murein L,D-transpeptidase YafK